MAVMELPNYKALRQAYWPEVVTLVIVAESLPVPKNDSPGLCFYQPTGKVSEPLFRAIMKVMGYTPKSKADGLAEMKRRGWLLVDATYEPVDGYKGAQRKRAILSGYAQLTDILRPLAAVPVIVIKANVGRLLIPRLRKDRFDVRNEAPIPFPSHSHQVRFQALMAPLISECHRSSSTKLFDPTACPQIS